MPEVRRHSFLKWRREEKIFLSHSSLTLDSGSDSLILNSLATHNISSICAAGLFPDTSTDIVEWAVQQHPIFFISKLHTSTHLHTCLFFFSRFSVRILQNHSVIPIMKRGGQVTNFMSRRDWVARNKCIASTCNSRSVRVEIIVSHESGENARRRDMLGMLERDMSYDCQ